MYEAREVYTQQAMLVRTQAGRTSSMLEIRVIAGLTGKVIDCSRFGRVRQPL